MPHVLIKPLEVARRLGIGRSTLFDMVSRGELPQPVRFNPRRIAFIESEVDAVIEKLAAQRPSKE